MIGCSYVHVIQIHVDLVFYALFPSMGEFKVTSLPYMEYQLTPGFIMTWAFYVPMSIALWTPSLSLKYPDMFQGYAMAYFGDGIFTLCHFICNALHSTIMGKSI